MRSQATLILSFVLVALLGSTAHAALEHEAVTYKEGKTVLEGYLAYDDSLPGKRPGILIVHDWMGLSAHTRSIADKLAQAGYVAFAVDVYGKGVRPRTPAEAGRLAGALKADLPRLRARAQAGLATLARQRQVDPARIVAIGYCFGGTTALELARSGANLVGVVSFHGGLATPHPADARNIKGKVLVLHGADDPSVPAAEVAAFEDEMRKAGVDWQLVMYGGAVHAFTVPSAGHDPAKGAAYDARADRRSWQAFNDFLAELFPAAAAPPGKGAQGTRGAAK
jgi:dienelactone hydrolase